MSNSTRKSARQRPLRRWEPSTSKAFVPWTREERIVLRVLNEQIPKNPEKRTAIFNRVFKDEGKPRDKSSLRAAWSDRMRKEKKTGSWDEVIRGPQNREERARWRDLESRVQDARKNIEEDMVQADEEGSEEEDEELDDEPGEEEADEPVTDDRLDAISTLHLSDYRETSLDMIHTSQCEWAGSQPYWTAGETPDHTTLSQSEDVFKMGGNVHRVLDTGNVATDLMLCNPQFCSVCRDSSTQELRSSTDGYPFVHSADIRRDQEDGRFYFEPVLDGTIDRGRPPSESFPRNLVYADGITRITEVCTYQKCRVCAMPGLLRRAYQRRKSRPENDTVDAEGEEEEGEEGEEHTAMDEDPSTTKKDTQMLRKSSRVGVVKPLRYRD